MATTKSTGIVIPGKPQTFSPKTPADYPAQGLLVEEFDIFIEGYAGRIVTIFKANTTDLMPCYSDPGLTQSVPNPQVLITKEDAAGLTYGRFAQHVYVPYAYELDIESDEQTGVKFPPITDMAGQTGDDVLVTATGSTTARRLRDRAADVVNMVDFGAVTSSASNNTTILTAAIAAASLKGGGTVRLPAGLIVINGVSLPESVILQGEGYNVTIIQSQLSNKVINITGSGAGLHDLQLDGINLLNGSIGIYGKSVNFISLNNVLVRRFDRNIVWQGGQNHVYRNLFTRNGNTGIEMLGDLDASGTGNGSEFSGLDWNQGEVSQHAETGMICEVVDRPVRHCTLTQIDFLDCPSTEGAIKFLGTSWFYLHQCYWEGNTINMIVDDTDDQDYGQVSNLTFEGGQIEAGESAFNGFASNIVFEGMEMNNCDFNLSIPDNTILFKDCVENLTLFLGDTTKISRFETTADGTQKGATVNATPTTVFKYKLKPHEVVQLMVNVTAEQTNGNGYADWCYIIAARHTGISLPYDDQTANFTVGSSIVGNLSGATAIIAADTDSGTTGTLAVGSVQGEFIDNEIITEAAGSGSATVNGSIYAGTVSLVGAGATEVRKAGSNTDEPPSGWAVTFTALQQEILVQVTGAASTDIFWAVNVKRVSL